MYLVEVQVHRSYKSVDLYLDETHTLLPTDVLSPGIEDEEHTHTHTHTHSLSLSLFLSLSHTHTHSLTQSLSLSHTHTYSLPLSRADVGAIERVLFLGS